MNIEQTSSYNAGNFCSDNVFTSMHSRYIAKVKSYLYNRMSINGNIELVPSVQKHCLYSLHL